MPESLHLLILEDEQFDAELIIVTLEEAGYSCQWERVDTQEAFLQHLNNPKYDLILADYHLPAFDGLTALKLFKKRKISIPFIIVSGVLGEERAIESLKAGATDYVLKQRMARLGPVVERALHEKEEQRWRQQAEDELRKLSQAVKQSPASIIITDTAGNIEYVNPKFTETTDYTVEEVIGENPRFMKSGKTTAAEYDQLWQTITTGKEWRGEFYNKKKDGTFFWEMTAISAIKGLDGNITHFLAVQEDITERKRIEEQAQQQERLASIGQMAAGIAHDFNNIMAVISLYSDLLASANLSVTGQKQVKVISQQSKRAAALIQQILDFSRRAILEKTAVEMFYQINELVKLWQRTLPDNINIIFNSGADSYAVHADPTRMQQMLMNLVINARDAMPDGGTLTISLERKPIAKCPNSSFSEMSSGEKVQIMVQDSGMGIAPEVLPHLYEPFFTTKEMGEGTGLGLAQVFGIVKQHEGHISVETAVDKGTTFTICLPTLPDSREKDDEWKTTNLALGNGELILIVEDNETTQEALIESLDVLNYQVIAANNGREALTIIDERKEDVELILCDLAMPEMSGEALLQVLNQRGSTLPFILVTAYVQEDDIEYLRNMGMTDWLPKPFQLTNLADAVAQSIKTQ
ncbi:MAG: response regulator [Chloroflexi bacterium]|nr:response regulator [Chloroflexota bacterium]